MSMHVKVLCKIVQQRKAKQMILVATVIASVLLHVAAADGSRPVCSSALLHNGAAKVRYAFTEKNFTAQVVCKLSSFSRLNPVERAASSVVVLAGTSVAPFRRSLASHAPLGHSRTEAMLQTQLNECLSFPNSSLTCFTSGRCNSSQLHEQLVNLVALSYVGWEDHIESAAATRRTVAHSFTQVLAGLFELLHKPMRLVDIPSMLRFESLFYEKWSFASSQRGINSKRTLRVASYPPLLQVAEASQSSIQGELLCPSEMVHVLLASQRTHLMSQGAKPGQLYSVVQEECITTSGVLSWVVSRLLAPLLGAEVMSEWSDMLSECVVYRRAASAPLCLSLSTPSEVDVEMKVERVVDVLFVTFAIMFVIVSVTKPFVVRHHSSWLVEASIHVARALTREVEATWNRVSFAFTGRVLSIPTISLTVVVFCCVCTPLACGLLPLAMLVGGLFFSIQSPSSETVCSRFGFVLQVWWLLLAFLSNPDALLCIIAVALLMPVVVLLSAVVYSCYFNTITSGVKTDTSDVKADNDPEDDKVVFEKANMCDRGEICFAAERTFMMGNGRTKSKRMLDFKHSGATHTAAALEALAAKVRQDPQKYSLLVSDPHSLLQFAKVAED